MTRLHIPEERSPELHYYGNKTRTVVKVCCDLYESHRENVLKKVDCHMEMYIITEELAVSSLLCTCGARSEGKRERQKTISGPDGVAFLDKVDIINDDSSNNGRCALCHCSPNAPWYGALLALELTGHITNQSNTCSRQLALVALVCINPYPTAFPYGNGMVLHFYQQQESSTTKTVHKVINKGLKACV